MKNVFILALLLLAFGNLCAQELARLGLSKIKQGKLDYLQDSSGRTYRVAYRLEDLDTEVLALVLNEDDIKPFPVEIFKQTQLEILILEGSFF